jgi:hypothetical protein
MRLGTNKDCADEVQQEFPELDWTEIASKRAGKFSLEFLLFQN